MADEGTPADAHVKVVYCGGCNPHIDRTAVAAELPVGDPEVPAGATVHVSGCPRACASDHRLTPPEPDGDATQGGAAVVVAGELVDGVPTPQADLAAAVTRKLKE